VYYFKVCLERQIRKFTTYVCLIGLKLNIQYWEDKSFNELSVIACVCAISHGIILITGDKSMHHYQKHIAVAT